jgi:hypothetical protein
VAGDDAAQRTGAAGDEHRAVRVEIEPGPRGLDRREPGHAFSSPNGISGLGVT